MLIIANTNTKLSAQTQRWGGGLVTPRRLLQFFSFNMRLAIQNAWAYTALFGLSWSTQGPILRFRVWPSEWILQSMSSAPWGWFQQMNHCSQFSHKKQCPSQGRNPLLFRSICNKISSFCLAHHSSWSRCVLEYFLQEHYRKVVSQMQLSHINVPFLFFLVLVLNWFLQESWKVGGIEPLLPGFPFPKILSTQNRLYRKIGK